MSMSTNSSTRGVRCCTQNLSKKGVQCCRNRKPGMLTCWQHENLEDFVHSSWLMPGRRCLPRLSIGARSGWRRSASRMNFRSSTSPTASTFKAPRRPLPPTPTTTTTTTTRPNSRATRRSSVAAATSPKFASPPRRSVFIASIAELRTGCTTTRVRSRRVSTSCSARATPFPSSRAAASHSGTGTGFASTGGEQQQQSQTQQTRGPSLSPPTRPALAFHQHHHGCLGSAALAAHVAGFDGQLDGSPASRGRPHLT
ncbi:hypothetical protein IWX92DRAFT_400566 [Phyllosticta citricarpa]